MSNNQIKNKPEHELLAGWVLGDLNDEETRQVNELLMADPSLQDELLQLEGVAAAIASGIESLEEMPTSLHERISGQTRGTTNSGLDHSVDQAVQSIRTSAEGDSTTDSAAPQLVSSTRLGWWREYAAWMGFAAASLVALALWFDRSKSTVTEELSAGGPAAERRLALIKSSSDHLLIDWQSGTTPFANPVKGDVVWSNRTQQGFMRFVGLPVNNPKVSQYQLWIIDPLRDDEPIDGGVFNVSKRGEVIVEIDPKLDVIAPKAFAITVEKPGGVVVSTQENLPLLAPVPEV